MLSRNGPLNLCLLEVQNFLSVIFCGPVLDFVKFKLCLLAILVLLSWFVFCLVGKLTFGLTNIAFSQELGSLELVDILGS